eukprot:Gb_04643 [translate_table: standard]
MEGNGVGGGVGASGALGGLGGGGETRGGGGLGGRNGGGVGGSIGGGAGANFGGGTESRKWPNYDNVIVIDEGDLQPSPNYNPHWIHLRAVFAFAILLVEYSAMDAYDDSNHPQLRPELMEAKSYAVNGMVLMTTHCATPSAKTCFCQAKSTFFFCLCEFEKNEKGRMLPRCSHSFHTECIDMWFHSHSTCPLCRTSAKPGPPSNAHVESGHTEQISSNTSSTEEPISSNVTEVHGNHICQHLEEGQASSGAVQQHRTRNALFWGSKNQIKERGQGSSAMLQITIEIPNRSNSFSYPGERSQIDSPKSPLQSLKRMLSRGRDGKVFPSTP